MNPLRWKSEHQLALVLAAVTGLLMGLMLGAHASSPIFGAGCDSLVSWLTVSVCGGYGHVWLPLLTWSIGGAGLGAAVIYIWQLMRA